MPREAHAPKAATPKALRKPHRTPQTVGPFSPEAAEAPEAAIPTETPEAPNAARPSAPRAYAQPASSWYSLSAFTRQMPVLSASRPSMTATAFMAESMEWSMLL